MTKTIIHGPKSGIFEVPSSKSQAHRMLITAALSLNAGKLIVNGISKDISATVKCLNAMGADIRITENGPASSEIIINPIRKTVDHSGMSALYKHLPCGESGSTLRFLIPVAGALGLDVAFHMEGRLSERPLEALTDTLSAHGMSFSQDGPYLYCRGQLKSGTFTIPGNISSQYISGLIMALPLLKGDSVIEITGSIESGDYIDMTVAAVTAAGIKLTKEENNYHIEGDQCYNVPVTRIVEKDWSSAAFPLCMGAFSEEGVTVPGLNTTSVQGDKEILNILTKFGADVTDEPDKYPESVMIPDGSENILRSVTVKKGTLTGQVIDASRIPDLVPVISVVAAGASGETRIIHAERLRLKESDRIATTVSMLRSIGADAEETEDGILIRGMARLAGGTVDPYNDHRIAMSAAVAAGICEEDVTVTGAECTDKSFPGFWDRMINA
jgi:3-phosphoshikimate 1-carboxyvinyltransferase